jgi:hypothetical protein
MDAAIGAMQKLEVLRMDYTQLSEKGLAHLRGLASLRELALDSATLTDNAVDMLLTFRQLQLLNVYHTLLTDAGHQKLKSGLPQCRIVYERESALPVRRGS